MWFSNNDKYMYIMRGSEGGGGCYIIISKLYSNNTEKTCMPCTPWYSNIFGSPCEKKISRSAHVFNIFNAMYTEIPWFVVSIILSHIQALVSLIKKKVQSLLYRHS